MLKTVNNSGKDLVKNESLSSSHGSQNSSMVLAGLHACGDLSVTMLSVRRDGEVWLRLLANFEMHGFRAAFQIVLSRYYPEILLKRPRLGCQGKALLRQQHQRFLENYLNHENLGNCSVSLSKKTYKDEGRWFPIACPKHQTVEGKVIQRDDDASYCESPNESSIHGAASSVAVHKILPV